MTVLVDQLRSWMQADENEHLEFKEAKTSFEFDVVVKYCAALANEGGGRLILGVTDRRPRHVVGSQAFRDLERTKAGLVETLRIRIEANVIPHPDGRVIVFTVPARPLGMPIQHRGAYWMRAGESLVGMTPDQLKRIFAETGPDFSAEVCRQAKLVDLDPEAIDRFRMLWQRKSGNTTLEHLAIEQLLADAELLVDGGVTYAALILLGNRQALGRHLAQAEVIFEYRSSEASLAFQQREELRLGALLLLDRLWELVNLRNDVQHFQDGLFVWDIPTFDEAVVREAIMNAVSHRDYRLAGSVFVRQYPRALEVVSPGGFPVGITRENILWQQAPRSRRIAETLTRCGLVERSGQGVNRMFETSIRQSKPQPDFAGTDDYHVMLTLCGEIQDPRFLRFLEKVGQQRLSTFTTQDLLVLDLVHREQQVEASSRSRLAGLIEQGIVEAVGRGRGTRYLLSRQFYDFIGQRGVYTRKRGLDRETNKALLLKHVEDNAADGCQLGELRQVLPALTRNQVQSLLRDLKAEGRVHPLRRTRGSRWYPGPGLDRIASNSDPIASETQS